MQAPSLGTPVATRTPQDELIPDVGLAPEAGLVSGEAVELDVRFAKVGSRALALLIDIVAQTLIALIFFLTATSILVATLNEAYDRPLQQAVITIVLVVALLGYPVLCETFIGGRTLGKLAIGLRVVRDDGGPIRFRHALARGLVGVAVEWPGLVLPVVTWVASLAALMGSPRGKRLGDLAAGTLVIHERGSASWGWVPGMPPSLAGWASTLDLTGLNDDLALDVRHFLTRSRGFAKPAQLQLGRALAAELAAVTTPPPPPGIPGWAYLAAVLAERHRRSAHRLARNRAITGALWPELPRPEQR